MIRCTVAIPVFNRVSMIGACIESALSQHCPDLEVLVVDNHSDDGTWEFVQTLDDARLKRVRNERNLGLFGNFNRCLELAEGKYLRLLCSDDQLAADCLTREVAFMDAHPEVALLSTAGEYVDAHGAPLGSTGDLLPPGVYAAETAGAAVITPLIELGMNPLNYPSGILIRRTALVHSGTFDPSFRIAGDVDLFLRILRHGDLAISPKCGAKIMRHFGQVSSSESMANRFVLFREFLRLVRAHRGDGHVIGLAPAQKKMRPRIIAAFAALSVWLGMACMAQGQIRAAMAHLLFMQRARAGLGAKAGAILCLVLRRLACRIAHWRSSSYTPIPSLADA